jgi:hypothetical protein
MHRNALLLSLLAGACAAPRPAEDPRAAPGPTDGPSGLRSVVVTVDKLE